MPHSTAATRSAENFESLPLHDATLKLLRIDWERRVCVAELDAFIDRGKDAVPCILTWHAVTEVIVPHRDPWGPSVFLNTARFEAPSTFTIDMQSGDQIRITADRCEFGTAKT